MHPTPIRLARGLATCLLAVALAGCGGGTPSAPPSFPAGSIIITAHNTSFDRSELILPAAVTFNLVLVNQDSDLHNIAIRTERGTGGELIFRHDPIAATSVVLQVGPIPAGTYYFLCEIHPAMTGTVLVQ